MQKIRFMSSCFLFFVFVLTSCRSITPPALASTATVQPSETPSPTLLPTSTPTPQVIDKTSCDKTQEIYHIGDGAWNMLVYSPDGRWLAAATTVGVKVYDAVSLTEAWTANTDSNLKQIAFSSDGKTLTGVDTLAHIYTWQVEDGSLTFSKTPEDIDEPPTVLALSSDGTMLAVPYYDDSIRIYRTSDGSLEGRIEQFLSLGEMIYTLAYSPNGKHLATVSFNGDLRIWSVPEKRMLYVREAEGMRRAVRTVFTADGKSLAVNMEAESGERTVRMLDVASGNWQHSLDGEVTAFSPDGSILSLSQEEIALRDYYNGHPLDTLPGLGMMEGVVAFTPDGTYLATGANDGLHVRQWNDDSYHLQTTSQNLTYTGLAVSPDGDQLAAGTLGAVDVHEVEDGSLAYSLTTGDESESISSVAYSPTGDLIAGALGSRLFVWQVENGQLLWSQDTDYSINQLAFSPNDDVLAASYIDDSAMGLGQNTFGQIPLWNARDGGQLVELKGPVQILYPGYSDLVFSADGNYLIASQGNGDLDVWSFVDNDLEDTLSIEDSIMAWQAVLAPSTEPEYFASGSMDRQIHIWKIGNPKPVRTINVRDNSISALGYASDGQTLGAGVGNEIRFWKTNTGQPLCSVKGSADTVREILFTGDELSFVSLADDGIVRVWKIMP